MEENTNRALSHREKVYHYVKECIISHTFRPGDMIYERALAQDLGVSRTPVREAIQTLQEDGWLTVVPRKGTMVRPLKRVDVEEVLQLRLLIGTASVERAAERAGPADIARFEKLIAEQEAAAREKDVVAFMASDMALHLSFVRFSGNRRMFAFAENLCDYCRCIGTCILISHPHAYRDAIEDHKAIVKAIADGDAARAREFLAAHLKSTRAVVRQYEADDAPGA